VAAPAANDELERGGHLLGCRAEVERPSAELEAVARALVDGILGPHRIRMLLDEPLEPEARPHFFVGCGDEDQVALRLEAVARQRGDRDRARCHLPFHVERAATPDLAVSELARPRVRLPFRGVRKHRVRMGQKGQPRPVAGSGNPGDEVRALRRLRVELARDSIFLEVLAQHLCGPGLVAGRIDRVEPDQLLQKVGDLVAQRDRRH